MFFWMVVCFSLSFYSTESIYIFFSLRFASIFYRFLPPRTSQFILDFFSAFDMNMDESDDV